MTSLFNKYEAYEPTGGEISDTAYKFMKEILQQYKSFSTIEVEKIVMDSICVAAAGERAKRAVTLRKQESEEFKRLYLGEFKSSEKDKELYDIGKYYHETCEAYDRSICSGPIKHGSIQPGSHYELININKHANSIYKQCVAIGTRKGFTEKEISKAIKEYHIRYGR